MQLIDPTEITEKQLLQVTGCVRTLRVLAVRLNEISLTKFGSLTESSFSCLAASTRRSAPLAVV